MRAVHVERNEEALRTFFADVADAVADALSFDFAGWQAHLERVVFDRDKDTASDFGRQVFNLLDTRSRAVRFDPDLMDNYLAEVAHNTSVGMVEALDADLEAAFASDDPFDATVETMDRYETTRSGIYATTMATRASNFGAHDGARAAGGQRKIWVAVSGNSRDTHAAMSGEAVALGEVFSNNLRWPGEAGAPPAQVANCMCALDYS